MLEAREVSVHFGGVIAVERVSITVPEGQIVGLVGPNGSGKTTFLNALTGLVTAAGSVVLAGEILPLGRPREAHGRGLLRTFQTPQTFIELSCIENVLLSTRDRRLAGLTGAWVRRRGMWRHEEERWERARAALKRVGMVQFAERPAEGLAYGQQRLLEIARALAAEPTVLMLDEPFAGLNATESDRLADILAGLRADGVTMLLVDHKIDYVDRLSDRLVVLHLGEVIAEGTPAEAFGSPEVVDAYLGVADDA